LIQEVGEITKDAPRIRAFAIGTRFNCANRSPDIAKRFPLLTYLMRKNGHIVERNGNVCTAGWQGTLSDPKR
jgi:hypothetical protein